jgi:hypothetical protein
MRSSRWLFLSILLAGAELGCVEAFHQSGKQVASGAIEGSAEAALDPETRRALSELMSDPVVRGLTEDARIARLEVATQRMTTALGVAMAESLERDVGPALERVVARSVARSMSEALGPATEQQIERISSAATRGALLGLDSLGGDAKGKEMGALARRLSEQATLGFQDAVRSASKKEDAESGEGEVLAAVGETADAALTTAPWLLFGLVALVVGASGLSVYLIVQLRKDHRKTQALAAALSDLRNSGAQ